MILLFILIVLLIHITTISSSCPNLCNGHGECDNYFRCTCYTGPDGETAWTGNDCSLRTCPKYESIYEENVIMLFTESISFFVSIGI